MIRQYQTRSSLVRDDDHTTGQKISLKIKIVNFSIKAEKRKFDY